MDWQTISPSQACTNLPISAAPSAQTRRRDTEQLGEPNLARYRGDRWIAESRCGHLWEISARLQWLILLVGGGGIPKPPPPRLLKPPPRPPLSPPRPRNDPLPLIVDWCVGKWGVDGCGWGIGGVLGAGGKTGGCGRKRKKKSARARECAGQAQMPDRAAMTQQCGSARFCCREQPHLPFSDSLPSATRLPAPPLPLPPPAPPACCLSPVRPPRS